MKKILFSLAALAALSMVAVGCKKSSDGAKDNGKGTEQKKPEEKKETVAERRVRLGNAVFTAFDEVVRTAKAVVIGSESPNKSAQGANALHAAVDAYIAALNAIKNDAECMAITDTVNNIKTNVNDLDGTALKTESDKLKEETNASNNDGKDKVYKETGGQIDTKSCEVGKLKAKIDAIKAKTPYAKK